MYDLETQRAADEINRHGATRVLVQLPDGLRPQALTLAQDLEALTGAEILLSGDSCYGACDLATTQAESLDADLLIHYGHSDMKIETSIPVIYMEARVDYDPETLLEAALPLMEGWEKIGLAATVQHVHRLKETVQTLRRLGKTPILGRGTGRAPHDGQILGCDYTTAINIADEVDGFLYIGAGRFHPLGLATATDRPVVMANPYRSIAERLGESEVMRLAMRRMAAITAAKEAERYGILVSTKPGQLQLSAARSLRDKLKKLGKTSVIICLDEISSLKLGNFAEIQAFVNTACPRIAVDGLPDTIQPVLTRIEAEIMLGERRWEETWGRQYFG
jgi:2-(3-amino-3-carboxypropyl)histidine synthase